MKKICIVAPLPPPMGGDAIAVKTLIESNEFIEKYEPHVINISDGKLRTSSNKKLSFSKIKKILNSIKKIKKLPKDIDTYYLTISQSAFGSIRDYFILKTIFKRKTKTSKVVIHLHGGGFRNFYDNTNFIIQSLVNKYITKVDKAIVLSESLVKLFEGLIDKDKIFIVENCVDNRFLIEKEKLILKTNNIKSKNSYNIIYLSNMILTKGYMDLLEASKLLFTYKAKFNFIFAGPFPNEDEKTKFLEYIKINNLEDYVKYIGIVDGDSKIKLLYEGDIFVLPTYYPPEGQPISILEAMSAAMPIITTNQGGIEDMVMNEMNGFIINSMSPNQIANKLLELENNRNLSYEIANRNIELIQSKYLEKYYINKMINIL